MKNTLPVCYAVLAAVCYGISTPLSKLLLVRLNPVFLAALLYLGAGLSMWILSLVQADKRTAQEAVLTKPDMPYIVGMVLLDILAPVLLMCGLSLTGAGTVSLLNNFEIVITTLIAWTLFKESIGKQVWVAIGLITGASILLSVQDFNNLSFSIGALLAIGACVCWGFENNCTRMLSLKDPLEIVMIKGFGSGLGALAVAYFVGQLSWNTLYVMAAFLLGTVAYGASVYLYILAQRYLGAARTSAYYAFAPFIGVGVAFLLREQAISFQFIIALVMMGVGSYLISSERHSHKHIHESMKHTHRHNHHDGHHNHSHPFPVNVEHSHEHTHERLEHTHEHTPDLHHTH